MSKRMVLTVGLATVVSSLSLSACGSDDDGGSGGSGGSAGASGSGGTGGASGSGAAGGASGSTGTGGSSGSTSTGGSAGAGGHPITAGCVSCATQHCPTEVADCLADATCASCVQVDCTAAACQTSTLFEAAGMCAAQQGCTECENQQCDG